MLQQSLSDPLVESPGKKWAFLFLFILSILKGVHERFLVVVQDLDYNTTTTAKSFFTRWSYKLWPILPILDIFIFSFFKSNHPTS
jgi:hypothetical protein